MLDSQWIQRHAMLTKFILFWTVKPRCFSNQSLQEVRHDISLKHKHTHFNVCVCLLASPSPEVWWSGGHQPLPTACVTCGSWWGLRPPAWCHGGDGGSRLRPLQQRQQQQKEPLAGGWLWTVGVDWPAAAGGGVMKSMRKMMHHHLRTHTKITLLLCVTSVDRQETCHKRGKTWKVNKTQ